MSVKRTLPPPQWPTREIAAYKRSAEVLLGHVQEFAKAWPCDRVHAIDGAVSEAFGHLEPELYSQLVDACGYGLAIDARLRAESLLIEQP